MKIQLLCAVALGLAATATGAAAQDSDSITVKSTVSPYCSSLGSAPTPLALGSLVDGEGFVVTAFTGSTSSPVAASYYCNAPATITLTAAPLLETTATPVPDHLSFTNRVDYLASLVWDNVTGSVNSATNAPASIASTEANTGALTVTVSAPSVDGTVRPIAGNYAGAVTLTVALN